MCETQCRTWCCAAHGEAQAPERGFGAHISGADPKGKKTDAGLRGDDGEVDPSSFHGGAAVGAEATGGKWVMQLCKEVPFGARGGVAQPAFVAARRAHARGCFGAGSPSPAAATG